MATKVGVVQFPGTNCEQDVIEAMNSLGAEGSILWHADSTVGDVDAIVIAEGSPMATICAPEPSHAFRRSWRR